MKGIGIVGMGVISRYYLAALQKSGRLALGGICDVNSDRLTELAPLSVPAYQDYRALMASSAIEGVVINVPNDLHFEVAREALRAGKHVCCEKPLTLDLEHAVQLQALAKRQGKVLFTAFHRRYNQNLIEGLNLVAMENIAEVSVHYLENICEHAGCDAWYLQPQRCGGGCIADNGPNAFDIVTSFLGDLKVTSATSALDARGVDRTARIKLRNTAGIPISIDLDWDYHGEKKGFVIRLCDGTRIEVDLLKGFPKFKSSLWHEYEHVLADFADAIEHRAQDSNGLKMVRLVGDVYAVLRPTTGGSNEAE